MTQTIKKNLLKLIVALSVSIICINGLTIIYDADIEYLLDDKTTLVKNILGCVDLSIALVILILGTRIKE